MRAELRGAHESYRYAVRTRLLAMPQGEAVAAERAVTALDLHRRVLDALPVPAWRQGAVRNPAEPRPERAT